MKVEYKMEEYRYGFSFPWRMLPERLQKIIDELEHSLEAQDLMDDLFQAELQANLAVYYKRIGYVIADELCERYDLAVPDYWN